MEVRHCDWWDGVDPIEQQQMTSTSTTTTTSTSSTAMPVTSVSQDVQSSTRTSKVIFLTTIAGNDDGFDRHDHHRHSSSDDSSDDSSEDEEDDDDEFPLWTVVAIGDCALVFLLLCVCMTCKWYKQKREIAVDNADSPRSDNVEGGKSYAANNTIVVAEDKETVL